MTTLTFGLLAFAQIKSHKHRLEGISFVESDENHDHAQITSLNSPFSLYKWIVFFYQLAFSLNWVVFLFFIYIFIFRVLNPSIEVPWWDRENTTEHYT